MGATTRSCCVCRAREKVLCGSGSAGLGRSGARLGALSKLANPCAHVPTKVHWRELRQRRYTEVGATKAGAAAERAGFETAFPASPSASAEPPSDVKTEANAIAHDEVSTTVDADTRRSDPTPADEDPKVLIRRAIQAHLARGEDAQAMALMALLSPTAPPTEAAPSPSLRALPGGKAAK
jgi:hypothetical protein